MCLIPPPKCDSVNFLDQKNVLLSTSGRIYSRRNTLCFHFEETLINKNRNSTGKLCKKPVQRQMSTNNALSLSKRDFYIYLLFIFFPFWSLYQCGFKDGNTACLDSSPFFFITDCIIITFCANTQFPDCCFG